MRRVAIVFITRSTYVFITTAPFEAAKKSQTAYSFSS